MGSNAVKNALEAILRASINDAIIAMFKFDPEVLDAAAVQVEADADFGELVDVSDTGFQEIYNVDPEDYDAVEELESNIASVLVLLGRVAGNVAEIKRLDEAS